MLRVIQFNVEDQISTVFAEQSIDYGIFSQYWANFMIRNNIEDISYTSSHYELDAAQESHLNKILQSDKGSLEDFELLPTKTQLSFTYSNSSNSNSRNNHGNDLRQFAGLIGGSFVNSYIPVLPVPSSSFELNTKCKYLYYLPKETLNAESLSKWLLTVPSSQRQIVKEKYQLSKLSIHRSDWYGIRIHAYLREKPVVESQSNYRRILEAKLSFTLYIKNPFDTMGMRSKFQAEHSPAISSSTITKKNVWEDKQIWLPLTSSIPTSIPTTFHPTPNSVNEIDDSENIVIQRRVLDSHKLSFDIFTAIPKIALASYQMEHLIEIIPPYYSIVVDSFSYRWCSLSQDCMNHWSSQSKPLPLSAYHIISATDKYCRLANKSAVYVDNSSHVLQNCHPSISINLKYLFLSEKSERNSSNVFMIKFKGKKQFVHTDLLPPDASYGVVIPPAMIGIRRMNGDMDYLSSESLLTTYPIPDRTMPYNVMTMVGTLFSFVIGSLINIFLKRRKIQQSLIAKSKME